MSAANTCGASHCIWVNRLGQPWSRSSGIAFEAAAEDVEECSVLPSMSTEKWSRSLTWRSWARQSKPSAF
jgi:hypothetical protein